MIYHTWLPGHVCGVNNRVINVDKVYWDNDDWPYMQFSEESEN